MLTKVSYDCFYNGHLKGNKELGSEKRTSKSVVTASHDRTINAQKGCTLVENFTKPVGLYLVKPNVSSSNGS